MRSSSLDKSADYHVGCVLNDRTLDFVFANVDEGWWIHHIASEIVDHLWFESTTVTVHSRRIV